MNVKLSFTVSACSDYESLLHMCRAALDEYRLSHQELARSDDNYLKEITVLSCLREGYERAYSRLVRHFENCEVCHSSQKFSCGNVSSPTGWSRPSGIPRRCVDKCSVT
jgi:hypothetical protein